MGSAMSKSAGNFLDALPSQGTLHVVMLGLDSAGKTTALYRLKFDQYLNTVPTIGFNCEKVTCTVGKAKGVQFLVWDVGGQEKLRPLWRSYTRCTDGILFVVDSVDVERMEEAKMELMRTTKCRDNQGVPVLVLANKQDLPGARDSKELEKLLGLHELLFPLIEPIRNLQAVSSNSSASTGNISNYTATATNSGNNSSYNTNKSCGGSAGRSLSPITTTQPNKSFVVGSNMTTVTRYSTLPKAPMTTTTTCDVSSSSITTMTATTTPASSIPDLAIINVRQQQQQYHQYKGWYIQPACAITGEGLQEGLEALFEMILKQRKLNKTYKKKR